eukprot:s180_g22.t1
MAILTALMGLPTFGKDKSLHDHIQGMDRLIFEYQKASGLTVPDEVSLSVLIRCLPAHIRQHIQLTLDETAKYATVRSRVLGFETVTNNWAPSRIHSEFGITGGASSSTAHDTGGPMPMDISRVETKGKQKGKDVQCPDLLKSKGCWGGGAGGWLRQAAGGWWWVRGFREDLTDGGRIAIDVGLGGQVEIQEGSRECLHGRLGEHGAPSGDQGCGHGSLENGRACLALDLAKRWLKVAASWLQRLPTSMPKTIRRQRRDVTSSGYVLSVLRRAAWREGSCQ